MSVASLCSVPSAIVQHAYTLFLFTKSDIKTTVIPITFLALASAPHLDPTHILQTAFWIWFHVLQFDVSNQTLNPEEDEQNKQDRPLPAKRLSLRTALILRWCLVPLCWALSLWYSLETLYASIALVAFTILYNECATHAGHWLVRNTVNAAGFASFEVGATLVASKDPAYLDLTAILSVCISAGIFATTIQAQDFKDVHGDRAIGRHTLPIVFPAIARHTILVDWVTAFVFVTLALFVSYRFLTFKTVPEDQVSFIGIMFGCHLLTLCPVIIEFTMFDLAAFPFVPIRGNVQMM
ncbi:Digeranylgeranylglyceryl phosphate synthase [Grifola frondosa]|uniref:Digeranylgeranylglyceryl phosphate synthase n=1 Tax=Grifola frondosa TaxID=5627 RepID=A0A1C7MMF7_GRIFR|nr:Digeranylgeranylglyceryl phosphate synthase [Grifola frondosa]